MSSGENAITSGSRAAPATLGRYEIVKRLATGGMAELSLARTRGIGGFEKLVALKRILPHHADDDSFVNMFIDEARLAATLNHPNIAQVYDIGVEDGEYFFTMEFIPGRDLRYVNRRCRALGRSIPLPVALTILIGMARGLHYAHEKRDAEGNPLNIIHRDISPPNVIITYDGSVKIVDFGIAKATTATEVTNAHMLKGKFSYMSPEQIRKDELDRRSDIFALGILAWELTTGLKLFNADTDYDLLNSIIKGQVPLPSKIDSDYPPGLEQVVMKCLATKRRDRYQSTEEVQIALEELALDLRVRLSTVTLSQFMRDLFDIEAEEWKRAESSIHHRSDRVVDYLTSLTEQSVKLETADLEPESAPMPQPVPMHVLPAMGSSDQTLDRAPTQPNPTIPEHDDDEDAETHAATLIRLPPRPPSERRLVAKLEPWLRPAGAAAVVLSVLVVALMLLSGGDRAPVAPGAGSDVGDRAAPDPQAAGPGATTPQTAVPIAGGEAEPAASEDLLQGDIAAAVDGEAPGGEADNRRAPGDTGASEGEGASASRPDGADDEHSRPAGAAATTSGRERTGAPVDDSPSRTGSRVSGSDGSAAGGAKNTRRESHAKSGSGDTTAGREPGDDTKGKRGAPARSKKRDEPPRADDEVIPPDPDLSDLPEPSEEDLRQGLPDPEP